MKIGIRGAHGALRVWILNRPFEPDLDNTSVGSNAYQYYLFF